MAAPKKGGISSWAINDNYVTSKEGWEVVKKYIPDKDKVVWCPFYHKGELGDLFDYKNKIHLDKDFYTYQPDSWDLIIDNPPYDKKDKVIKRCIELGKPFALLLPLLTLERQYYKNLVVDNPNINATVVIPKKRIKFIKEGQSAGSNPCVTGWFLFNILPDNNKIIFET